MLVKLFILNLLVSGFALSNDSRSKMFETVAEISSQGYQAETHYVTTIDGYILQMHRIPYKRYETSLNVADRPVVFLMHGLTASSDAFIRKGYKYSMAYNLADSGFDVWMGNARGNIHSRQHVTLDPDDNKQKFEFFDFTWEEIGMYDLPAMIDYVLQHTNRNKLHYIGHSQGCTAFFVMNSMKPEYNQKVESAHLMASVGYMEHHPDQELARIAVLTDLIYILALSMGIVELYPGSSTYNIKENCRISDYCTGDVKTRHMCELFGIPQILGERDALVDKIENIFEIPGSAGAASKQFAHFGQNLRDKSFRRWHYGSILSNLKHYGVPYPPNYDISLATMDTTLHYTISDHVLGEQDVFNMAADMPNAKVRKVARESFLHDDFIDATDAKELVTDYIINAIKSDSTNN